LILKLRVTDISKVALGCEEQQEVDAREHTKEESHKDQDDNEDDGRLHRNNIS
jgi:hypothetical protein